GRSSSTATRTRASTSTMTRPERSDAGAVWSEGALCPSEDGAIGRSEATSIDTTLVIDFDGTVTYADVGDEICDRFADPRWRELDARWERKEIALPDAQLEMWAMVAAPPAEVLAYAREIGRVRAGLGELLDAAAARGVEVVLASGGFDFYIEAILGERLGRFARVFTYRGELVPGRRVRVSFPHRAALGCALCGA